jgi:hypothetical protein
MDKQIKEKLEKLDALSGGIVFAKDEAWERLQARMDKKPARKIAVKFWLAAAAILLLFVCITAMYYSPEKEIVVTEPVKEVSLQPIAHTATLPQAKEEVALGQDIKVAVEKKLISHSISSIKKENKIEAIAPQQSTVVEVQKEIAKIEVAPIIAAAPVKKQMRVVHINDLDNEDAQEPVIVSAPHVDMGKMKVVAIGDIATGDRVANTDKAGWPNKPIPFLTSPYRNINSESASIHIAQNPLQLKFNVQN